MSISRRSFLVVGAACATSACASKFNSVSSAEEKPCCNNLSEAAYSPYTGNAIREFEIGDSSSSFAFATGRSNFVDIKLDESSTYRILEFVTASRGIWLPAATIFIPRFSFLDSAFRELGSVEPEVFQNTGKLNRDGRSDFYGATMIPPNTRYVLAYTDASKLDTETVLHLMADSPGASRSFAQAKATYFAISTEDFAMGRIRKNEWWKSYSFSVHNISRRKHGEIALKLT